MSQLKAKIPSTTVATVAATSEQIRLAQILNGTQDITSKELDAKIKQVFKTHFFNCLIFC
jgi:hypothetical protein